MPNNRALLQLASAGIIVAIALWMLLREMRAWPSIATGQARKSFSSSANGPPAQPGHIRSELE